MTKIDISKVAGVAVAELAKSMGVSLWEKIKGKFKKLKVKNEIELEGIFSEYLQKAYEKISKVKTLLHNHDPKDIHDIYECVDLLLGNSRQKKTKKKISANECFNLFEMGHKLLVTGTAGIGKSMFFKHCFVNCIDKNAKIPILIELRGLNSPNKIISLMDYIYQTMENMDFKLAREYFEYSFEFGKYAIFFDGFDELNELVSQEIKKEIIDMSTKYSDNYYIISSRHDEQFSEQTSGWNDFIELQCDDLTKKQAISMIKKLDYNDKLQAKFIAALKTGIYEKHEEFAKNPLLLTIMFMIFDDSAVIPSKLVDFFEFAFSALFHKHDTRKGGFEREKLSKLDYSDFKNVFAHFCFKSFFNGLHEFREDEIINYIEDAKLKIGFKDKFKAQDFLTDLKNKVCVIVLDGLKYHFAHRSFQEYFAACYARNLDDKIQSQAVVEWIKRNGSGRRGSLFIKLLSSLEPLRFEKNVLLVALKELVCYNDGKANCKKYIRNTFDEIGCEVSNKDKSRFGIWYRVVSPFDRLSRQFIGNQFSKISVGEWKENQKLILECLFELCDVDANDSKIEQCKVALSDLDDNHKLWQLLELENKNYFDAIIKKIKELDALQDEKTFDSLLESL